MPRRHVASGAGRTAPGAPAGRRDPRPNEYAASSLSTHVSPACIVAEIRGLAYGYAGRLTGAPERLADGRAGSEAGYYTFLARLQCSQALSRRPMEQQPDLRANGLPWTDVCRSCRMQVRALIAIFCRADRRITKVERLDSLADGCNDPGLALAVVVSRAAFVAGENLRVGHGTVSGFSSNPQSRHRGSY